MQKSQARARARQTINSSASARIYTGIGVGWRRFHGQRAFPFPGRKRESAGGHSDSRTRLTYDSRTADKSGGAGSRWRLMQVICRGAGAAVGSIYDRAALEGDLKNLLVEKE